MKIYRYIKRKREKRRKFTDFDEEGKKIVENRYRRTVTRILRWENLQNIQNKIKKTCDENEGNEYKIYLEIIIIIIINTEEDVYGNECPVELKE